ncbi:FUSC family protein [Conyzicola sp.]|uniref:FUSC family protein n=1 Tax=Conyzicola sp. TaxID=1969404 RepID=UPI003989D7DC
MGNSGSPARSRLPLLRARLPVKAWVTDSRLLLAAKTSLAVGIAWFVAPFVPGVADDYPYYAPLGALISMTPTLMGSVRVGLQTLVGLAVGILLAGAVILFAEPNFLTIALVVGLGVLVSGFRWLSQSGGYAPVAALFVLIVGGGDAESYSIGYIVQMGVGIAVGLIVNFAIFPPLRVTAAVSGLHDFRTLLATHLDEMADALVDSWPPANEDWADRSDTLRETADAVRDALRDAEETGKGNPRARLHKRDLGSDYADLYDLESITFHVRDVTDVLAAAIWQRSFAAELPAELREPLSDALRAIGGVLESRNAGDDVSSAVTAADSALEAALARLDEQHDSAPSSLSTAASVAVSARRILAIMAQRPNGAAAGTAE